MTQMTRPQEAAYLYMVKQLDENDVAAQMGIDVDTVKSYLQQEGVSLRATDRRSEGLVDGDNGAEREPLDLSYGTEVDAFEASIDGSATRLEPSVTLPGLDEPVSVGSAVPSSYFHKAHGHAVGWRSRNVDEEVMATVVEVVEGDDTRPPAVLLSYVDNELETRAWSCAWCHDEQANLPQAPHPEYLWEDGGTDTTRDAPGLTTRFFFNTADGMQRTRVACTPLEAAWPAERFGGPLTAGRTYTGGIVTSTDMTAGAFFRLDEPITVLDVREEPGRAAVLVSQERQTSDRDDSVLEWRAWLVSSIDTYPQQLMDGRTPRPVYGYNSLPPKWEDGGDEAYRVTGPPHAAASAAYDRAKQADKAADAMEEMLSLWQKSAAPDDAGAHEEVFEELRRFAVQRAEAAEQTARKIDPLLHHSTPEEERVSSSA